MLKHTTHTHIHVHMLTRTFTLSRAFSLLTHTHAFIHLCTYTTISLYLCLFSCPTPSFSQTATYRHALKHLAKCVVSVSPLSVTPGMLLNGLLGFSLCFSRSQVFILLFNHKHTHTYLWLFMCHRSQLLMIQPTVISIPLHHPLC